MRSPKHTRPLPIQGRGLAIDSPSLIWRIGVLVTTVLGFLHPVGGLFANDSINKEKTLDSLLSAYFLEHQVASEKLIDDRTFARRAYLDLIGLLPTPEQLQAFEAENSPTKRAKLVDELLADNRAYAEHWLTFWSDSLRNAYRGTGFIDGGRKQITGWLFESLYNNKPYDQFVRELISPVEGSEGFTWGIKWRGVVNESQRREIQAAQGLSLVFLGTNLKCASCHDSFINDWKLADAYALASVFADKPLEIHRCNKPTGDLSGVGFLFTDVGTIDANASRERRQLQLAGLMVKRENKRLAQTIVNRLWATLMGPGLVEPPDDMSASPWNEDILKFLANDLVAHKYDVKQTLRTIATSRAYQLQAVSEPEEEIDYVFHGPYVKRMSAEQYVDAVRTVTGVWPILDGFLVKRDGRGQGGQLAAIAPTLQTDVDENTIDETPRFTTELFAKASWIWSHSNAHNSPGGEQAYFRREIEIKEPPATILGLFSADNSLTLHVNGKRIAASDNWQKPLLVDLSTQLKKGKNVVAIAAANGSSTPNPAGLVGQIVAFDVRANVLWHTETNVRWQQTSQLEKGWEQQTFDASSWKPTVIIGNANAAPWGILKLIPGVGPTDEHLANAVFQNTPIRAALSPLDELQSALGRPNREQIVLRRESRATMLQALELTNGAALDKLVKEGAKNWLRNTGTDGEEVTKRLYLGSLGRLPSKEEQRVATELLAEPVSEEGLADLLWILVMLPEFQLID